MSFKVQNLKKKMMVEKRKKIERKRKRDFENEEVREKGKKNIIVSFQR